MGETLGDCAQRGELRAERVSGDHTFRTRKSRGPKQTWAVRTGPGGWEWLWVELRHMREDSAFGMKLLV